MEKKKLIFQRSRNSFINGNLGKKCAKMTIICTFILLTGLGIALPFQTDDSSISNTNISVQAACHPVKVFKSVWDTRIDTDNSSNSTQIQLPLESNGKYCL